MCSQGEKIYKCTQLLNLISGSYFVIHYKKAHRTHFAIISLVLSLVPHCHNLVIFNIVMCTLNWPFILFKMIVLRKTKNNSCLRMPITVESPIMSLVFCAWQVLSIYLRIKLKNVKYISVNICQQTYNYIYSIYNTYILRGLLK